MILLFFFYVRRTVIALVEMIAIGRNLYLVPDIAPKNTPHSSNHPQNVVVCLLAPLLFLLLLLFVVRQHSHQKLILLQLFFFIFRLLPLGKTCTLNIFRVVSSARIIGFFLLFRDDTLLYLVWHHRCMCCCCRYIHKICHNQIFFDIFFVYFPLSDHFRLLLRIFRCSLYFCFFFLSGFFSAQELFTDFPLSCTITEEYPRMRHFSEIRSIKLLHFCHWDFVCVPSRSNRVCLCRAPPKSRKTPSAALSVCTLERS